MSLEDGVVLLEYHPGDGVLFIFFCNVAGDAGTPAFFVLCAL